MEDIKGNVDKRCQKLPNFVAASSAEAFQKNVAAIKNIVASWKDIDAQGRNSKVKEIRKLGKS